MRIALALLIPLLLPTPAREHDAAKPAVDLLAIAPADALLVVSTDRFDAIRERASQNTWKRFFADERLGIGQLFEALLESQDAQHPWASATEVLDTVHGQALFFFAPVKSGKDFGGGGLVQPEAGLDAFLGHYDRLLAWAETQEDTVRSAKTYEGVDLDVLEHNSGGEGDAVVLFETEGVVGAGMATNLDDALGIAFGMIDRIGGHDKSGGFASNAEFVAARGSGSTPALDVHVQIQELIAASGEGWDDAGDEEKAMARKAGLDKVRWAHLRADVGTGEVLDLSFRVHVPRGTLAGDLADLLGPLPTELLKQMPGEGTSFLLANYDVAGLWKAIKAFMAEEDPEALKEMEAGLAEGMGETGLDLEELIGALTGRFASFDMRVPAEEMPELAMYGAEQVPDSVQQGGAWFIGMSNMDLAGRAIEALLEQGQMGPMVKSETYLGTPIHSLDLGMVKPHWALLPDGVAMSMYPTPLRAFVRQRTADAGPSAADEPRFADTARSFGGASVLTITDTATSVGTMLGMVQMLSFMAFEMVEDPSQYTLFTDPPDPKMAAQYFKGTTIGGVRREGDVLEIFAGAR